MNSAQSSGLLAPHSIAMWALTEAFGITASVCLLHGKTTIEPVSRGSFKISSDGAFQAISDNSIAVLILHRTRKSKFAWPAKFYWRFPFSPVYVI